MIPDLIDIGSPWNVLPAGIHLATLEEIEDRFATNVKRRLLFAGFRQACRLLKNAGCKVVYLDGSYVTEKPNPSDFDACWEHTEVNPLLLDQIFKDTSKKGRDNQKAKFGGEIFIASFPAGQGKQFLEYFQHDKDTRVKKGIIQVQL